MKLKELVHREMSGNGCSPAFWLDEGSGNFFFQGYRVDAAVREGTKCPTHEDLVRAPASFWEQLKEYAIKAK